MGWGFFMGSRQHPPHPPAGAADLIGDALLTEASAAPPAAAVAVGFKDPSEQENRDEQQGQGPGREAGDGHGEECCGDQPGVSDRAWLMGALYTASH